MNSSQPNRPRAKRAWFADDLLHVELEDGRVLSARYDSFPRLVDATDEQRAQIEIIGRGVGLHWSELDEDLSTDGLLRDAVAVAAARAEAG